MKRIISLGIIALSASFSVAASDGLVKYESNYSVKETANRFEDIAKSKGLTLFARVDHQKNAASVNLELRPTEVIIFGNPKVGTPLMQCAQDVAIDLPQKVMVSEDDNKKVWLTYNNPTYLMERHQIQGCDEVIKKISGVLSKLSEATVAK
ncbi:hypothetical protein BCU85_16190 [Vibrio lentus]|uniref:DUF302 domain-containing protein n=1 Tax=Vibrio lentus TaxID=136468 RepID=UPI000C82A560|nr:DUF302 domain-containing protein [Vibrio lentus]MCC4817125.1 DUF302 domain-containing protein [Vibrio lentus]PMG73330.1 hypothetical protein BCU85_16190 [Vibrio lentus]PMK90984.1 hypothetical protein BCT88_01740 [Vibrio lentus]PML22018.1 hypothetical protein BCT80_08510 [Vibrio lentus]PMM29316.1 hypothetical protein BCT57_00765 [Vibrio lentus]